MKKQELNYHAVVFAKNWATTTFQFHAESASHAMEHIQHVLRSSDVSNFDGWIGGKPDELKLIRYKFKGNQRWIDMFKTIPTVELKAYEFQCEGCGKVHKMNSYAIAQTTMGNEIIFTCPPPCKHKTSL